MSSNTRVRRGAARAGTSGEATPRASGGDGEEWYTFKHGENTRWLVEETGLDLEALQRLNPNVDLSAIFPGDRIVIREAKALAPKEQR